LPRTGQEIIGAGAVAGGVDLYATLRTVSAAIAGAGAVALQISITETGFIEVYAGASAITQPASRQFSFSILRGVITRELENGHMRVDVPYHTRVHAGWVTQGDVIDFRDQGGALGDNGLAYLSVRRLGT